MEVVLTPEVEAKMPDYMKKWVAHGIATGNCPDKKQAEKWIKEAYKRSGHVVGGKGLKHFIWCESPLDMIKKIVEKLIEYKIEVPGGGEWTIEKAWQIVSLCYGSQDSNWLGYYDMIGAEGVKPASELKEVEPYIHLAKLVGWFATFSECVFICHRASVLTVDDTGELHNETGPAMAFTDGLAMYAWHGRVIPKTHEYVIKAPETLTVDAINSEQNLELKRIMIDKFTEKRYWEENRAESIAKDEYGESLQFKVPNTTATIVSTRVVDASPRPNGEREVYYVPGRADAAPLYENGERGKAQPKVTAKALVAASFGMTEDEYHPLTET